ncbi:hypothetical protein CDAR_184361 [Caerostris darwini]|uniref:Uncharacterized protein n=1 Tax=Caerostris darwini TaxID=1538125 RepID=A0AAV4UGH5_9ARAC|nr:hypothetical protein CDAR_184361 [Caerostris darwini]
MPLIVHSVPRGKLRLIRKDLIISISTEFRFIKLSSDRKIKHLQQQKKKNINKRKIPQTWYGRRNIFFRRVIRSEREDERGLPKGCSINLDFSEKGNQKVRWAHPSSHAGHISTRETFLIKGVHARPGLCVTFGSKLHLLSAPLSLYIFIWMEMKWTALFGLIAGILKSNFGQGPLIVHSGVNRRHQRKIEIDSQASDGR